MKREDLDLVVEFMLLNSGVSLRRYGPLKQGNAWKLQKGDVTVVIKPRSVARRQADVETRSGSRMRSGKQSANPADFLVVGKTLTKGADKFGATLYNVPSWHGKTALKRGGKRLTREQSTDILDRVYRKAGFNPDFSGLKADLRHAADLPRNMRRQIVADYKARPTLVRSPKPLP